MNLLEEFRNKNYVNGEWIKSSKYLLVLNPANQEAIGSIPNLELKDIKYAIDSTVQGFNSWSHSSFEERIVILRKWYELIIKNIHQLSEILTLEQGKILPEAEKEVLYGASFIDWYTNVIHNICSIVKPGNNKGHKIITHHEPIGPVCAITPWNFPVAMVTRKVVPAIAAGCSVILKPSSLTPFSALALAKLSREAGLPPGVFNVITGDSELIAKEFCNDFRIRKLSFTGSTNVGSLLYKNSAVTLKRLSLELGGNAPFIITDDNNLERVANDLITAKIRNSGQSCTAPNRIFIHENIYNEFIKILANKFSKLKVGDGFDKSSDLGPLINKNAIKKIDDLLQNAIEKDAKVICGGSFQNNFYEPTIIINCQDDMKIFSTEIFGPVIACYKYTNIDEAIKRANNTEYGLQAYIYSQSHANMIASKLDFGMVSINAPLPASAKAPFAGRKASGFGVEGSFEGIYEYLNTKYINMQSL